MLFESSVLTLLSSYSWSSCKLNSKCFKRSGACNCEIRAFCHHCKDTSVDFLMKAANTHGLILRLCSTKVYGNA